MFLFGTILLDNVMVSKLNLSQILSVLSISIPKIKASELKAKPPLQIWIRNLALQG
jgi:hypothetical protein